MITDNRFFLVLDENVSLVVSRQILITIMDLIFAMPADISTDILLFALEKIQPRAISFEEQSASIRQHLADIYENQLMWLDAAHSLVAIPLETGQK